MAPNSPATNPTSSIFTRIQLIGFAISNAGMIGSFLYLTTLSHYTREGFDYLAGITLAFLFYGLLLLLLRNASCRSLLWLWVVAFVCRAVLWTDLPTLSSDVWRYLWDGQMSNAGINPYMYRVDDPRLDPFRTSLSARIDHTYMATPYPPVAQIVFGFIVAIQPASPLAMQVVFTLFDVASAGLIVLLLRALGRPDKWVMIYLLNPLIITEFAHGAHIDSMMTFFILLAIWRYQQQNNAQSSLALAVAVLTKYIPAILVPLFLRRWSIRHFMLFGAVVILGFVPFFDAGLGIGQQDDGSGIFGAVRIYTNEWKTNDGFFYGLVLLLEPHSNDPIRTARIVSNLILLLFGGWILLRTPSNVTLEKLIQNGAVLISVYLLLAAAMFPWYLTWLIALLPLLPFHRKISSSIFLGGWLYFTWAVQLSYLIYLDPTNPRENLWMRYAQYGPLFGILFAALLVWLCEQRSRIFANRALQFWRPERNP